MYWRIMHGLYHIFIVVYGPQIHDSKYSTTRVLFASTYTAKQLKTIYYSLTMRQPFTDDIYNLSPKYLYKISKNIKFQCHIWNHYEKCIEISTNMLSIVGVLFESRFLQSGILLKEKHMHFSYWN